MQDSIRLLHIEDSVDFRVLISTALRIEPHFNFVLSAADSVGKGLELLRNQVIDVVLLDWRLPDKSGAEAIRAVRSVKDDVPIVVLTANDAFETAKEAKEAGADAFLSKTTFNLPLLVSTIHFAATQCPRKDGRVIAALQQYLNLVEAATSSIENHVDRSGDEHAGSSETDGRDL
jgi:DNA-binding response OmpR family regulator